MAPIDHRLFEQPWPEGEYRMFQLGFVVDDVLEASARWAPGLQGRSLPRPAVA